VRGYDDEPLLESALLSQANLTEHGKKSLQSVVLIFAVRPRRGRNSAYFKAGAVSTTTPGDPAARGVANPPAAI